jgi:15-cis-phytoene synthase
LTIDGSGADLTRAYKQCRAIAQREAKNFYYSFLALPARRRNAICAVYAFMRQADDLADDESLSRPERRRRLETWLGEWRRVTQGGSSSNPVFLALEDATQRFQIPHGLLEELVAGVTMDLAEDDGGEPLTYASFADLYRYCYLVASVVGLVCIRIFGYQDSSAEQLAEETGIAFQLTNILRDVSEDAARRRIYLPREDLAASGVSLQALLDRAPGTPPTANERALLRSMAERAEHYYVSAQRLLPLIDRESRPALWVLVSIYHTLLKRIEQAGYDVFTRRAGVGTGRKLAILAVGLLRTVLARLSIQ